MGEPVVESIYMAADAGRIYELVADVGRMGEWSPEATGARGASGTLGPGDRFLGLNRRGPVRWFTVCTVRAAQRGVTFAFDVDFGPFHVSRWEYRFRPEGAGTRVTESWTDRRTGLRGAVLKAAGQLVIPGSRPQHNRASMVQTLRRLKEAAERED
jgi:hypothetical protein